MARYRRVDTRIQNDAKFRGLSLEGQHALYTLLLHQHMTSLGAMRGTAAGFASEMGESLQRSLAKGFREIVEAGLVEYDEKASFMALPRFLRYNPPESPNVVRSWSKVADLVPECPGKTRALMRACAIAESLGEAFVKAFADAFPKGVQPTDDDPSEIPFPFPSPSPDDDDDGPEQSSAPSGPAPPKVPPALESYPLFAADRNLCRRWSELVVAWEEAFPGVDLERELAKAHAWQLSHAKRRKKDQAKALWNWLQIAQDKAAREVRGQGGGGGAQEYDRDGCGRTWLKDAIDQAERADRAQPGDAGGARPGGA